MLKFVRYYSNCVSYFCNDGLCVAVRSMSGSRGCEIFNVVCWLQHHGNFRIPDSIYTWVDSSDDAAKSKRHSILQNANTEDEGSKCRAWNSVIAINVYLNIHCPFTNCRVIDPDKKCRTRKRAVQPVPTLVNSDHSKLVDNNRNQRRVNFELAHAHTKPNNIRNLSPTNDWCYCIIVLQTLAFDYCTPINVSRVIATNDRKRRCCKDQYGAMLPDGLLGAQLRPQRVSHWGFQRFLVRLYSRRVANTGRASRRRTKGRSYTLVLPPLLVGRTK